MVVVEGIELLKFRYFASLPLTLVMIVRYKRAFYESLPSLIIMGVSEVLKWFSKKNLVRFDKVFQPASSLIISVVVP
jgi:hypothetical protein